MMGRDEINVRDAKYGTGFYLAGVHDGIVMTLDNRTIPDGVFDSLGIVLLDIGDIRTYTVP